MGDVRETGPWEVFSAEDNSRVGLLSHDFTHDVVLWISGDFADFDERMAYAEEMAKRLNNETRLAAAEAENEQLRAVVEFYARLGGATARAALEGDDESTAI